VVRHCTPVRGWRLWALVAACALAPTPASARLGEPDPGYGKDGLATSAQSMTPADAGLDAAGRAVIAGLVPQIDRSPMARLVRLDARGADDPAWGDGGVVDVGEAQAVLVEPAPGGEWLVARVDPQGLVSFTRLGADGAVIAAKATNLGSATPLVGLELLPDGGALLASAAPQNHMAVRRFDASLNYVDGLDAPVHGPPLAFARDARGGLLFGGTSSSGGYVMRYTGSFQRDFAWDRATRFVATSVNALEPLPDGRVLIGGADGSGAMIARLTAEGAVEEGFGGTYRPSNHDARVADLLVDATGGAYAAGTSGEGSLLLTRFDDRGRPDPTLQADGSREIGTGMTGFGVALDAQERPHVFGAGGGHPVVARLLANAAPTAAIAGPGSVPLGGRAIFDASGSEDPERALRRFEWDLDGNGTFEFDGGTNPGATQVFGTAGEQRVSVRVTDHRGLQSTATHRFEVLPQPGPAPVLGEAFVAEPASGTVLVRRPGRSRFERLMAGEQIPEGSIVDVRRGRVRIVAARDAAGATDTAEFYLGRFRITQTGGAAPYTTLALYGGNFGGCGPARPRLRAPIAETAAKRRKRRVVRRLWGDGHGRFRTKGRYASATVRGTKWQTIDRCDGVELKVARGVVEFRDLLRATRARRVRAGRTGFVPSKRNP
jgi:hypothetical protein